MKSGYFITIDGGDGAGKSLQAAKLRDSLETEGYSVFLCRDPGTTRLGEAVREILLNREEIPIAPQSEMLLFMAARAEMISENILPALEEGKVVIADRFLLSTLVYQGIAGGLALEEIMRVGEVAVQGRFPDLTILLDISAETARSRLARPLDRIEKKGLDFHKKVESGYREALRYFAAAGRGETARVNADGSPSEVASLIWREVQSRLPDLKCRKR